MAYTATGYMAAWVRSIYGMLVALIIWYVLKSFFLALLAFAFLFFWPIKRETDEKRNNMLIFGGIMIFILFYAFEFGSPFGFFTDIGLGLSLGEEISRFQKILGGILLFVLVVLIIRRAFMRTRIVRNPSATPGRLFDAYTVNVPSTMTQNILIAVFFVLTVATLQPWLWNASAIIFTGVWLLSFLTGTFTDVQARQGIGVMMVIVSFLIYTLGIGSAIVGEATFGQWWPVVKEFGEATIVPLISSLDDFMGSLKQGYKLLTCPACAVQDIVSGRFGKDPDSGLSGAFGIEFTRSPRTTTVFPYTDYSVTMEIKNQGAVEASNVVLKLLPGTVEENIGAVNRQKITLQALGFDAPAESLTEQVGNLSKQESRRIEFATDAKNPLNCKTIRDKNLETKSIPLVVSLSYDYKVNSRLPLEVFDRNKWEEEIVKKGRTTEQKKPAELTNSPVKLDMDLGEQPKKEEDKIIVSMKLDPAKKGINMQKAKKVVLYYPAGIKFDSGKGCKDAVHDSSKNTLTWDGNFPSANFVNCHFELPKLSVPATTFEFSAEAEYTAATYKTLDEKIEWKTGCCSDSVCGSDLKCSWKEGDKEVGRCSPKEAASEISPTATAIKFGDSGWCGERAKIGGFCEAGWGGCGKHSECIEDSKEVTIEGKVKLSPNICRRVSGFLKTSSTICCYNDPTFDVGCRNKFNAKFDEEAGK